MSHEAMREQLQNWVKTAGNDAVQAAFEIFVSRGEGGGYTAEDLARWESDRQDYLQGKGKSYTREEARAYVQQRLHDAGV